MLFLSQRRRRRRRRSEQHWDVTGFSAGVARNSGGIEEAMRGPCHLRAFPEPRGRKWPGTLAERDKPSSVSLYPSPSCSIQMSGTKRTYRHTILTDLSGKSESQGKHNVVFKIKVENTAVLCGYNTQDGGCGSIVLPTCTCCLIKQIWHLHIFLLCLNSVILNWWVKTQKLVVEQLKCWHNKAGDTLEGL